MKHLLQQLPHRKQGVQQVFHFWVRANVDIKAFNLRLWLRHQM